MTTNRNHNHSLFPTKHTTQEHQLLILLFRIPLYYLKGLQKVFFLTLQKFSVNNGSQYLKFFKNHSCDVSTGFGSLLIRFTMKINLPLHYSRKIWTTCVFQTLFIATSHMRCFVSRGFFTMNVDFACLIRAVGKVALSVKFI